MHSKTFLTYTNEQDKWFL